MDEETQATLFDPFFTTKHPDGGTGLGLGLSQANSVIRHSGGAIEVSSAPGAGTTFSASSCPLPTSARLAAAHGCPQEENLQIAPRQAPRHPLARGSARQHVPPVWVTEARAPCLPDVRHL